jgi:hypothetical protein
MLPKRAAGFITRNLRNSSSPVMATTPSPDVVSVAWGLLCNQPPEMVAHYGSQMYYDDPWELALLAVGAAEQSLD